jgi:hypothetical protein
MMKSKDQVLLEEAYSSILVKEDVTEEIKLSYFKAVESLKGSDLKVVSLKVKSPLWNNEELMILNDGGRDVILIDLGTIKLPFYKSTGEGGKERVAVNKWYPIFGIAGGWFNKASQTQINHYYGSELLKATAQKLDALLGENDCGFNAVSHYKERALQIINQDLNPSGKADEQYHKNIANVLSKVGGAFVLTLTGSSGQITARIPFEFSKETAKRAVGEDSKFFSSPQFELLKSEKYSNVLWKIRPSSQAKNKTYVNGQELLKDQLLKRGDIITLGKSEKGKMVVDV